jgi:hypothetical protein
VECFESRPPRKESPIISYGWGFCLSHIDEKCDIPAFGCSQFGSIRIDRFRRAGSSGGEQPKGHLSGLNERGGRGRTAEGWIFLAEEHGWLSRRRRRQPLDIGLKHRWLRGSCQPGTKRRGRSLNHGRRIRRWVRSHLLLRAYILATRTAIPAVASPLLGYYPKPI